MATFLVSKQFLLQILIAVVTTVILVWLILRFLSVYTKHGREYSLPDFTGMTMEQIDSAEYNNLFDFYIDDSIYSKILEKGTIAMQDPSPGSKVKKHRNVYITTVAIVPEKVPMPDLLYLTLRQALNILKINKLQPGYLIYQPSFDRNAVLQQMHMGDTIKPDTMIFAGSSIDLVLGAGSIIEKAVIPVLIGKTASEAKHLINLASLNLGKQFLKDSGDILRVYMQDPNWKTIKVYYPGDSVHLWLRSEDSFNFNDYLRTIFADTIYRDTSTVNLD
ncbi:MAG: PASTA domain-containing protein [Bacteroidales bacterium]|nr:PASTA domain-containing protein [Bacteroidales bacterium]